MARMLGFRGHSRFTASITMSMVAVMLLATCLLLASKTPEQMACCASMHGDCDMGISTPCCDGQAAERHSIVAAKPTAGVAPAAVLVAVLAAPAAPVVATSRVLIAVSSSAASPPGVATYVFVSSFRI